VSALGAAVADGGYEIIDGTTELTNEPGDPEGRYVEVRTCAGPHYAWLQLSSTVDVDALSTWLMREQLKLALAKLRPA
jgi:hypothetical protein